MLRAASSICSSCTEACTKFGLSKTPMTETPGTSSRSGPSRFGSIRFVNNVTPVAFPPGRLKALDQAKPDWIAAYPEYNRDSLGRRLRCKPRRLAPGRHDSGHLPTHQIGG